LKIKILHIAKTIGGVGVYTSLLSRHLDIDKFENVLICNGNDENIVHIDNNLQLIKVHYVNFEREISLLKDYRNFKKIIQIIKDEKPSIIHSHSAKAGVYGRVAGSLLKIPTLYTPHAFSFLSTENKFKNKIYKLIEQYLGNKKYSTILACSASEKNQAININIKKEKILVWNNSIPELKSIKIKKRDKIITIARTTFQKNLDMLINVAELVEKKYHKKEVFMIIGADKKSKEYKELMTKIKLKSLTNIVFLDWTSRKETLNLLQTGKMIVSTSRYEGLPYALIESLSLSKPIIATNVDGNRDLVKDNYNGYLIENFDEKIMANKINILLENEIKLNEFEKNAKNVFMKNFNIKDNIKTLERIYKNFAK